MAVTSGRATVDTPGFPVRLSTMSVRAGRIDIYALRNNTDVVYIGDRDVIAKVGYSRGTPLFVTGLRGDVVTLTNVDLSEVWLDSIVADEGVEWGAFDD
jgi:hypothetical protein